ncbi:MAG: hypothetical protein ACM31G_07210 [Flavobacteriales bacterium]
MPKNEVIHPQTQIELVATKGEKVFKSPMPYSEALKLPKKKGWNYQYFQVGFCTMETNT